MINLKIFHINVFSSEDFKGNPAGVMPLNFWLDDTLLQNIAAQNGLTETAFFVKSSKGYHIRWFTPEREVHSGGHATLAAGYVLAKFMREDEESILFESHSGDVEFYLKDDKGYLIQPAYQVNEIDLDFPFERALGLKPEKILQAADDIMVVFEDESQIEKIKPNFRSISRLKSRGLIVTAPGEKYDFVSRFFAPSLGIDEDPVTGSSHTKLIPYWAKELNKNILVSKQLSSRTGIVYCENKGDKVIISGDLLHYLSGEIHIKG